MTNALARWTAGTHTHEGTTHPTYRQGSGPGVVVIHEVPGLTEAVVAFAQEVVDAGYTVVLPHLFGAAGRPFAVSDTLAVLPRLCVSREFAVWRTGRTAPVAGWLRSLAADLHHELGGPGVGALGMCFTGGFALAMMVEEHTVAPVLCQPSVPFAVGAARAADLNLSPGDLDVVKGRCAAGQQVLGLRYRTDPMVGTRFDTLTRELGDAFIRVEFDGRGHSTVTEQRQQEGVDAVMGFLETHLHG
ncbi:MAG: dienelactone hydrolase family protein [Nocardioides sp.]|uniref:dienelactone hydrolase family protein n=1 Tax=Nocardioides sp. TaxID=35761 RepID=UPI003F117A49